VTTTARQPGAYNSVSERQALIAQATRATHSLALALGADCALLDTPAGQCSTGWTETGGVYSLSYVRNPGAKYVRITARVLPTTTPVNANVTLDLTITDALGNSVASSDNRIPRQWKSETIYAPFAAVGSAMQEFSDLVVGYVDCDDLDSTLTDPTWSFDVTLTTTGGAQLDGLWIDEMPRFLADDGATHGGIVPGAFQRDATIHDGATDGLDRLLATLASGRTQQRSYLAMAWRQSVVAAETPSLTSAVDGPFTLLTSGAGVRTDFAVYPRSIAAVSAAGEAAKVRYLYRFEGGAGTETAQITLRGSATGSLWTASALAYTTSWTWSAWVDCAVRTSPLSDALSLSGKVSAGGPTLWLAGVHVREAVT
jgi:hypothetical protein